MGFRVTSVRGGTRGRSARVRGGRWRRAIGSHWKLVGLAGVAGVAATGVVVARNRRAHRDLDPDELRERLRARLAAVGEDVPAPPA